jgi:heterodisulfide reductase subunit C
MEKISSNRITDINTDLLEAVIQDEALKAVRACIQCGNCTAGCPSGRRTALKTRQIMRKATLGLEEVLNDEDIWMCSTCYTCFDRCPRNIPVTDIIIKLRNLAVQKGNLLPAHKSLTHLLFQTGHCVPLGGEDSNWAKLRESYGLSKVPPTVHSDPAAVEEVVKLLKLTHFNDLVGWEG